MAICHHVYTNTDDETGEIVEPHVNYYGGDDEAPRHFQTLSALTDYDCGEEFLVPMVYEYLELLRIQKED